MIPALLSFLLLAAVLGVYAFALSRRYEALYPVKGELVDVGPGALHVVETAAQGGERGAVLLVHGASGNFADLHEALAAPLAAEGFRVFSVDRPGHGWSDRLGARSLASSPERQAEWLRAALQARGVERAIVVVHSLAGVLGLAMALNAKAFVRGLVLLAPVSHPWPGGVSWYYSVAASRAVGPLFRWLLAPLGARLYMRRGLAEVFAPNPTPSDYIRRTRLPLMLRPSHFRANAEDVVDIEAHVAALSPRYREIDVPTAIVTGDADGVVYAHIHSEGCARDIPGATLTVLEGVGHSPHYAAPEKVVATILEIDRRAREAEGREVASGEGEFAG